MRAAVLSAISAAALCAAAGAFAATPAAAGERVRPLGSAAPLGNEPLSDELRLSRYARTLHVVDILRKPTFRAARVGRLRLRTEDGPPEVYLLLRSHVDSLGRVWIKLRVPKRPNGTTGWVQRTALGQFGVVTTHLRINRTTLRATLYKRGRKIWSSPIGVGQASTPTPAGRFWIRERIRNLAGGTAYGPWAFGTAAYSGLSDWPGGGVIGVHGTDAPQLIPGRPSHGCIRVPNEKVSQLARLMPIGTPVRIV